LTTKNNITILTTIQPYFIANPRAKSTHMNNKIPNTTMAITRLLSFFINSSFFLNNPRIILFCLSGTSGSNHLKKLHFLLTKYFPHPWNLLPGFSSVQAVTNGESTPQWQTTFLWCFKEDPLIDEDEYSTIFVSGKITNMNKKMKKKMQI